MHRRLFALVVFLTACLVLGACSAPSTATTVFRESTSLPEPTVTTEATGEPSNSAPTTTTVSGPVADPLDDNAIAFVAALEEAFAGTTFAGAVLDSPEVFVATAEVICVRLDNGDQVDQILVDYVEGLSNADGGADTVSENEAAVVAGGVLGASLELFCPQHLGLIKDEE